MWKVRPRWHRPPRRRVSIPLRGFRCGKMSWPPPTPERNVSIPLRGFRCGKQLQVALSLCSRVSIPLRGFRCGKDDEDEHPSDENRFNPLARIPMWKVWESSPSITITICFNPLARIPMWKAYDAMVARGDSMFQSPCEDSDVESHDPCYIRVAGIVSIPLRGFRCGKMT